MILEFLANLSTMLIKVILIPVNIPSLPNDLENSISCYIDLIFNNIGLYGLINFFVREQTLVVIGGLAILVLMLSKSYKVAMWIIRKIPLSIH